MTKKLIRILAILIFGILAACDGDESPEAETVEESAAEEETEESEEEEETTEPVEELSAEDAIRKAIEEIAGNLRGVEPNKIDVNLHMARDDGSYIALPHLKWTIKNKASTTRNMLRSYSDQIAAELAEASDDVSELTVFWEVPYHLEGNNVIKYGYERTDAGMVLVEEWIAPILQ